MMSFTIASIGAVRFMLGAAWMNLTRTPSGSQVGVVIGVIGAALTIGALIAHGVR
jgi:hypothetical protein